MKTSLRVVLICPYSNMSAIGLRTLSSCLKQAGHDVRLLFLPVPDELVYAVRPYAQCYPESVLEAAVAFCQGADLVGITVMTNFAGRARQLTEAIQRRLGTPVIWGGIHATVEPERCLESADLVCVGEGEEALVTLAGRMARGEGVTGIPNIWSRTQSGKIERSPVAPLLRALDTLPLPDYQLEGQFVLHRRQIVPLTPTLLAGYLYNPVAGQQRVAYMVMMTRGCPYHCSYCCNSAYLQIYPDWRHLRRRSLAHTLAELEQARDLIPGLEAVMFLDDNFFAADLETIRRFSHGYRERVGLPFYVLGSPGTITAEKVSLLVTAGLCDVEVGIQAGSRRIRRLYNRYDSEASILGAAQVLQKFRRQIPLPVYDVITDNPYETEEDQEVTLRLLEKLPRPYRLHLFSLVLFPGTELAQRAAAEGLIRDEARQVQERNYLMLEPTYYNLLLWGFQHRLPVWFLHGLTRSPLKEWLSSSRVRRPIQGLWAVIRWARRQQGQSRLQWMLEK